MIISLIIPVFNSEKYLFDCLGSVFKQMNKDVELIIINDGSNDSSDSLINCFEKKLPYQLRDNFISIRQKNKGVSYCRNLGISLSKGRYIAFLDADDTLEENFFEKIISQININHPDIIQFNFNFWSNKKVKSGIDLKSGLKETSFELFLEVFNWNSWYPWSRVYKKELFSNHQFPIGYTFEDPAVIPFLFLKSKTIFILDEYLYNYRDNPSSITRGVNKEKIYKNMISLDCLLSTYLAQNHILFKVCFIHFFRIYLDYCFKYGGVKSLREGWSEYSCYYYNISRKNTKIIQSKAGRLFICVSFLSYFSYFIVKFASNVMSFLKNK